MYYNECMKNYFNDVTTTSAAAKKLEALAAPEVSNTQQTQFHAYQLDHNQSVIVGHTYIVKVDSLLRCPVFESNEKQVFDIDGVLSTYYNCSDSDNDTVATSDTDDDDDSNNDGDDNNTSDTENDGDNEDAAHDEGANHTDETSDAHTKSEATDDPEFELIQEQ